MSSDMSRCYGCGTYRIITLQCPECYNRKQFSKLLEQNERQLEIAQRNSSSNSSNSSYTTYYVDAKIILNILIAAVLLFAALVLWVIFHKVPDTRNYFANAAQYITVDNDELKKSLSANVTYTYSHKHAYRDCESSENVVCLTSEQAEMFCQQFDGVNTNDTYLPVPKFEGRSNMSHVFNITKTSRGFNNDTCIIKVEVDHGNEPAIVADVLSWKLNSEGKLVAFNTGETPIYWATSTNFE